MDSRFPSSFRSVPFLVDAADMVFGRRVASHEYPYRDDPWTDDMGRRQRSFSVNAFIIGDDVQAQREALINALEQQGPGILIHPRFGQLRVQIGEVTWRSSSRSNREDFVITCLEPGNTNQPQTSTNTLVTLEQTVNSNLTQHSQTFAESFSVVRQLQYVLDDAADFINNGLDTLREINGQIQGVIAPVSDIAFAIDEISNELSSLIRAPQQLASAIVNVVSQTIGLFTDVDNAITSYQQLDAIWGEAEPIPNASSTTALPAATANTAGRQQQQTNRDAVANLFNRAALVVTTQVIARQADGINVTDVSQSPFTSYDHALTVRNTVVNALTAEMQTADYASYEQLAQLQSDFHRHVQAHGISLPRLREIPVRVTQPALVMAYRLYADASRASDIATRNRLRHPLFIDAGKTMEVASA